MSYTLAEAAAACGINKSTVLRAVKSGRISGTKDELGTTKGAGQILGDLVRTGAKSADDLKSCTDSGKAVQNQAIDVLNAAQAGTDVNPLIDGLNSAIDQNTNLCNSSQQSYQAFVDALSKLQNR